MEFQYKNYGELYGPAMKAETQEEADQMYADLVEYQLLACAADGKPVDRVEAERIVKINLGYYAGYYSLATAKRVNRLFKTTHPIFGDAWPTAEEAMEAGKKLAESGE